MLGLILMSMLLLAPCGHATARSPAQLRSSLELVDKLLRESSVAQHVRSHRFPVAMAYLQEAERLHGKAKAALARGEEDEAAAMLHDATQMVLEAGRLSHLAQSQFDKVRADYADRLRSINALREAEQRIMQNRGLDSEAIDLERHVSKLLNEAQSLAAENRHNEGRVLLDQAYALVKNRLRQIGGDRALADLEGSTGQSAPSTMTSSLTAKQRRDYQDRLNSINALREALQRISREKGGDTPENQEQQVIALLEQARVQAEAGRYVEGRATLDHAYQLVKSALEQLRGGETLGVSTSSVAPPSPTTTQAKATFDARLRSVMALLEAQQRIATDKGLTQEAQRVQRDTDPLLQRSNTLAQAGRYDEGIAVLKQAYTLVTESVEKLRGGETLVRSLHFKNKKEEYLYELDRNDSYLMLVNMMLADQSVLVSEPFKARMNEADTLRKLAERQAREGNHDAAVQSLEQSTELLIRALRDGGVMVPG